MIPIKILQVIEYFSPQKGGSVLVAYEISKMLALLGHEVTLTNTDFYYDKAFVDEISKFGVKVVTFKNRFTFQGYLYSPSLNKWAKENLQNYDIIHMHNFRSYQNRIIYKYSKKYNIPYILHPNGSILRIIEKKFFKYIYDTIWGNRMIRDCTKIIAVSDFEINQFQRIQEKTKIAKIYNMLNTEKYNITIKKGYFRTKFQFDDIPILLFVGRIHKRKGIYFLINTFKELKKEIKNAVLVIIGPDGGEKKKLLNFIEDLNISDIHFIDYIDPNNNLLYAAYQDADIVIYPSILEIFGLVPFEVLLNNTPVIVTNDCGCGEIINEADCGYLVNFDDIKALKEMIKYIISHKREAKKKVENGKKYILEHMDSNVVVSRIVQLYKDILKK